MSQLKVLLDVGGPGTFEKKGQSFIKTLAGIMLLIVVGMLFKGTTWGVEPAAAIPEVVRDMQKLPIPFAIQIDPMERLLLVNFENDPDSTYEAFEPQVFADALHGTGHAVLGWRVDGRVDVFHQPGLTLDPKTYDTTGKGLGEMVERQLESAFFEVDQAGVQAYYSFDDLKGRSIEIKVEESNTRKRRPFSLLAPVGEGAETPPALPVYLLHEFDFVRRKDTDAYVAIDGRRHELDPFPIPVNWSKVYYMRYSPDPLLVNFHPNFEGTVSILDAGGKQEVNQGNISYRVEYDNGIPVLQSMKCQHNKYGVEITFQPAFPNLFTFPETGSVRGSFTIVGSRATGKVEGHYTVERIDDQIITVVEPSRGWIPRPTSLFERMMFTVQKAFKDWPKSYQWTAVITEGEEGLLYMDSAWERKE